MDMHSFLNQLLQSGKDMAQKGQDMAEQKLGIPAEGVERDQMLSGLKTGAAAAGVLALLLGTGAGRRVTGAAVKVGSLAALGGLAYQMYRQWETGGTAASGTAQAGEPAMLEAPAPKASTEALMKAMIAAAKADGHVDSGELEKIRQQLAEVDLDGNVNDMIMEELAQPRSATDIAALANNDIAVATELYLVSAAIIDDANDAEKAWLTDLRAALQLPETIDSNIQSL
ncbi:DUF533 domain-containing protein [Thiothrix nivea]|uniref:DUF533 domain-containing protein n=1 Tax=Thiothrix nivea (strain ATCC 35100 / DSM 5205 / JP2) TaxID=870187 RepID=A0A656HIK3_THINJ|nr:DUF533 domain-containing protein [Thiothrix nivea]EIJ36203.1 protein of unknown function DUF533 [Thiothrix nivea DSM 5205]